MKNPLTYGQLDSICMDQAGNLSQNDIDIVMRQAYINTKLMKYYRMADGLNNPWYDKSTTLTVVTTDQEFLTGSDVMALDSSAKTITRGSGSWVAGEMLHITIVTKSSGAIAYQFVVQIVSGTTIGTYTLISGTASTYNSSTQTISVIGIKSYSSSSADISSIYLKEIISISDLEYTSGIHTVQRLFFQYKDINLFNGLQTNPMKTKIIGWYQRGDTVLFFVGASANALGTVTMQYRGKPTLYDDTTISSNLDMPPEDTQIVIDEIVASFLIAMKKQVSEDLQARLVQYEKMYQAAEAERLKAMEIKNK